MGTWFAERYHKDLPFTNYIFINYTERLCHGSWISLLFMKVGCTSIGRAIKYTSLWSSFELFIANDSWLMSVPYSLHKVWRFMLLYFFYTTGRDLFNMNWLGRCLFNHSMSIHTHPGTESLGLRRPNLNLVVN